MSGYRVLLALVLSTVLLTGSLLAQDSLGMRRLSELVYWPMSGQIQVVRNLAYIYGGDSGLHIVNIADPAHPQEVGRFTWDQWYDPTGGLFYVSGNRAYIGFSYDTGGLVIDVSDSTHPQQIGWWSDELDGIGYVHGNWAVGFTGGYPYVLDISNPANVHHIGDFPSEVYGDNITAAGTADGHLCLTGSVTGLYVFDMSNPAQPVRVAAIDTTLSPTFHCVVSGNYAYLATMESGLRIIDLSNPLAPVEEAVCDSSGSCMDVAIAGTHACVLTDSVRVWDVADPAHPFFVSSFPLSGRPVIEHGVIAGAGSSVLVSLWVRNQSAVVIEDISNPGAPRQVSSLGVHGALGRFAVAGDTAYVVDSYWAMRTINLGDAAHPFEMGRAPCRDYPIASDVGVYSHYAYLLESDENWPRGGGLVVFDISNAAQPESLGTVPPIGLQRILVHGDYAYVFGSAILMTFSLATPSTPMPIDWMDVNGGYRGISELDAITVADAYLYYGSDGGVGARNEISILSLVDPAHPAPVGDYPLPGANAAAVDMAVNGHYAFIADRWGGLITLDLTDPAQPTVVGQLLQGDAQKVALSGHTLVVKWANRLSVMDVTDLLNPIEVGYYDNPEWLQDMKFVGPHLVTSSEADFRTYQVNALAGAKLHPETPHEFALRPCYPNPFNPSTVIRFSLPQTEHARLAIYDITGRQVRVLTDGVLTSGEHQAMFDGSELASGVYFARLEAGKNVQTRKMVLMK